MAKSITPRILVEEETGKRYQFDPNALNQILSDRTDKKKHITKNSILLQLEEQTGLTVERVNKWLSAANGIGHIDNAKMISEFLGIDYHEILIDMNPVKEDKNMFGDEEKTIIKKVFGECVLVLYKVSEMTNAPKLARKENIERCKKNVIEVDYLIRSIHMLIDQNSIALQKYNRYNLHRILLELNEYMCGVLEGEHNSIPERWEEINNDMSIEEAINFPNIHNRDTYLSGGGDDAYLYLLDEISLADEMGLSSCVAPTDEEWNVLDEIEDCVRFGYTPANERYELTPNIIWIDLMVKELTLIFEIDFPNLFDER
ncbi:MAG: hypothetical protein E7286_02460 [Lachnospiraceae bacterium]|nr:hypothetical protein [Lachnospiraceae bacterium]